MNIDEMSGAELDALAATRHMGWHQEKGYWADETGLVIATIFNWRPSSGKKLSAAASDVLLKALGEGITIEIEATKGGISVSATEKVNYLVSHVAIAPTLPVALVRAICKAVAKQEQDKATFALARAIREDREKP